jgi:hypothetical protein
MLGVTLVSGARAFDETRYPDWRGQWTAIRTYDYSPNPSWDPNKAGGLAQSAPLTPEYQARLDASLADQRAGGAGLDRDHLCMPAGMPRMMNVYGSLEILVMPDTTYMLLSFVGEVRRIYTDGRDWPATLEPAYTGYSIGKWIDSASDGRFDVLEIETRGFRGPRTLDSTAIPLHEDNQTVVKERISSHPTDRSILRNDVTLIDGAFSRPWTVAKTYRRSAETIWREGGCVENNPHVRIGNEDYMISGDGFLMPAKKDQPAPDLRYFNARR